MVTMQYSRAEHIKFLDLELQAQTDEYISKIQTSAVALLENDEVFSCQFVKIENGLLILKFKNERAFPRKGDYLTAVLFSGEMASYHNWGNITWADLRKQNQIAFSDAVCVFHAISPDREYSISGFRNISLEFAEKLEEKCIVVLGPKEPPFQYLKNLIDIVKRPSPDLLIDRILDFDEVNNNWSPILLDQKANIVEFILNQVSISREIIIQGPPGTGKTTKMAQLASVLLDQGKSVLVTALTNRALIELASVPVLAPYVNNGKVSKTNITLDEHSKLPKLTGTKEIICRPGELCLSTFYISSAFAAQVVEMPPFDYLIMDEASQAFLAMFAGSKLLGKHVIWIGDPFQLPPVVLLKQETIKRKGLMNLIQGLTTLCNNLAIPSFILNESYRLTPRATEYTGLFYNNTLVSRANNKLRLSFNEIGFDIGRYFNPKGGPTLLKIPMPLDDAKPASAVELVLLLIANLSKVKEKEFEIAVLTKRKKTVKEIQKRVTELIGSDRFILIDTIEKVQGLTCDVCIFLIPNSLMNMSLEKPLFNVATSRAKRHTIIISDPSITSYPFADSQVIAYIKKLDQEYSFTIEPKVDTKLLE